jgi:hypothetical protein
MSGVEGRRGIRRAGERTNGSVFRIFVSLADILTTVGRVTALLVQAGGDGGVLGLGVEVRREGSKSVKMFEMRAWELCQLRHCPFAPI